MSDALIGGIIVFVLAAFLGIALIGRVPPTLHTPLMSATNAISGIIVVGAIAVAAPGTGWIANLLGLVAIILAMMNVVGGYAVTDRMLGMFRKEPPEPTKPTASRTPKAGGS